TVLKVIVTVVVPFVDMIVTIFDWSLEVNDPINVEGFMGFVTGIVDMTVRRTVVRTVIESVTSAMPHEASPRVTSLGGGGCSKHEGIDQGEDLLVGNIVKDSDKSADKRSDSTDDMANVLGTLGAANILASGGLRQHSLMEERVQSQDMEITQLKTRVQTFEDNEKRREEFA
nr:hypothetical protein [Tanacetum cinerariifolium]